MADEAAAGRRRFHRLESSSQTAEIAARQTTSGELWGGVPRWGYLEPVVQAYDGPLPEGRRGIEFETDVEPDVGGAPHLPTWRGPRPGVVVEGGYAKIRVSVLRNTQTTTEELGRP